MDNYNNNYQQDYNQGYNQGYDPGYGGYPPQQTPPQKSIKGLKIMIVILAVILGALSVLYFTQVKQMQADYAEALAMCQQLEDGEESAGLPQSATS